MKLVIRKPAVKKPYSFDPRVDGVTQSQIATWLECREKARLTIIEGLTSRGASRPFIHGNVMHGALDRQYTYMMTTPNPELKDAVAAVPRYVDHAVKAWRKENTTAGSEALEILEEAAALSLVIHHFYIKHWWKDDTAITWKGVEEQFKVPINVWDSKGKSQIVWLVGKRDGEFEDKRKQPWLFETKNKGQFSAKIGEVLPLDLQLGTYLTSLTIQKKIFPKFVRYNLVRRPQEKRKQTETLRDFAERIGANIAKDPNHYFQRFDMELGKQELEQHMLGLEMRVQEFYRWWEWSMERKGKMDLLWNGGACENKYGTCHALPVCANGDRGNHEVRSKVHPELA